MVNATANFFSQIGNHGLLTLQKSTLNATAINFGSGTIHGNGTISDNVSSLGTISPAGTLTFGGNLTLLGSSVVIMELTGYGNGVGTNDVINVAENFQYAGKLVVTNTTGFAYAPGQSFQLFNFSTQTGQFSATNLPDLAPIGLAWDTSQLNTSGLLIVYGPVNFTGWQLYYFGCTNCPQAAPGADPLGKGISNYNQDLLGLNPTNAASVWRVTSVVPTGANCVVTWRTGGGNTYRVQATNGKPDGSYNSNNFQDISGPITIDVTGDSITNYTDVGGATNRPARYYRIRLGP